MFAQRAARATFAIASAAIVGCADGVKPETDGALVIVSGDAQVTLPGGQVPRPLVVRARDASGNPQAGVLVQWTASGGSRFVSDTSTTNEHGLASAVWLLAPGTTEATYTATATGDGPERVEFSAQSQSNALQLSAEPLTLSFDALDDTATVGIRVRSPDGSLDTLIAPNGWGSGPNAVAEPGSPTPGGWCCGRSGTGPASNLSTSAALELRSP